MTWDMQQVKKDLCGPASLMMAPFNDDLSLNLDGLKSNIRYVMSEGMKQGRGFIVCPSGTGEYVHLDADEHLEMVRAAMEVTEGKVPVMVGIPGTNIREVIRLGEEASKAGARYAMIPPPYYYEIDQGGIFEWYRILSDSLDLGIMGYDQIWRGKLGTHLGPDLIERLAELENVVALKYGGPSYYFEMVPVLDKWHDRFAFIDNSLGYTAPMGFMHGASGFISGPSAWWPEFELAYYQLILDQKYAEAERWRTRMDPYMQYMTGAHWKREHFTFQTAVMKASLEYIGLYGGPLRPPMHNLAAEDKKELWKTMDKMGVKKIHG